MARTSLVVSLLAMIAFVAGCRSGGPTGQGLALGSAPWQDGDRAMYDVVDRDGNRLGRSEFTFAREGGAWVLSAADEIGELHQACTVRIDAQTLQPLDEEKTVRTPKADVTLRTSYTGGQLEIKAVVNGEDRSATISVPAHALDNDQLLMTLRALQFADGYQGSYVNVVAASATKVKTMVRVQGKETVEVPAGNLEAWRVELDFGQARQHAWYQVDPPHHMVQYDNGTLKFVLAGLSPS